MWWQASLVVLALTQARPQELTPEQASDLYSLMERLHTERVRLLSDRVKGLKQNARLPQELENLKFYRSELRRLSQKDEPYIPELEAPVKLGDFGSVHYAYEVLGVVGPKDVVIYRSDPTQRDPIAWITDYDTSEVVDGANLPLDKHIFYATETRSYTQVGGSRRTVPVMRPLSENEVRKIWTEGRKQSKKKKKK